MIDKNNDGSIDVDELLQFGKFIGQRDWTRDEIIFIIKTIDKDGDKMLSMTEFQVFCADEMSHHSTDTFKRMIEGFAQATKLPPGRKDKLEMVFQYLLVCRGKKDGLKFADMLSIGMFMNNSWDEAKCTHLVNQMDVDGDGVISKQEWLVYFAKLGKGIDDDRKFMKGLDRYLEYRKDGRDSSRSPSTSLEPGPKSAKKKT